MNSNFKNDKSNSAIRLTFSNNEEYATKIMNAPRLGKEDTFAFRCLECGKCCRDREDILLTPLDIFKMSKHLQMSNSYFIASFCESYEGQQSKMPVIRLKPREYRKTCPLNEKGKCRVHAVKPTVCALFPLGRATDGRTKEFFYFLQDVPCGDKKQTQTISQWLKDFSILEEESFTVVWHKYLYEFTTILTKINLSGEAKSNLLILIAGKIYFDYKHEENFEEQFKNNCDFILNLLKDLEGGMQDEKA